MLLFVHFTYQSPLGKGFHRKMMPVGMKDNRAVLIRSERFYVHPIIALHHVGMRMSEAVPCTDTVDGIQGMNGTDKLL